MIIVRKIVLVIAFIVGSFAVFGLHPSILRRRFFYLFPPARFLANALMGLDKLQALDEEDFNEKGVEIEEGHKQGKVKRGNTGFNELAKVLKESTSIEGKIQDIILVEGNAGVEIGYSSKIIRILYYSVKGGEGVHKCLPEYPFDPDKPTRDLRNWIEDSFRKQLAYWTIGSLAIWLLANSYMLYLLNE